MNRYRYSKTFRYHERGAKFVETCVAFTLVAILVFIIFYVGDVYYNYVVHGSLVKMTEHIADSKQYGVEGAYAIIAFRPVDAPYTSYHISSKHEEVQSFKLPGGVRIVNTNGIIRNHTLRVNATGQFVDENGTPIKSPNPGILTIINDRTDRVFQLHLSPEKGEMTIR